ncbi:MAG: 4Fe-4S dicluster domain-containing protein [Candidatus Kariarchaeaceae archaeon]
MTLVVKKSLIPELKNYGAFDVTACYNCGQCTATCPLVDETADFPRKIIRYAQLGLESKVLGSEHLWSCYYCGDCTDECPREADPAGFMMASRRYAISRYDVTRIGRLFNFSQKWFAVFTLVIMAALTGALLATINEVPTGDEVRIFDYVEADLIHDVGMWAGIVVAVIALVGVLKMIYLTSSTVRNEDGKLVDVMTEERKSRKNWITAIWSVLVGEVMLQKSFKEECDEEKMPWYKNRWLIHMTIFWGFMSLFAATALDFLFKDPEDSVSLLYPPRLIGTVGGIVFMFGVTLAILNRLFKTSTYSKSSEIDDWIFLLLLFFAGLTGFILEIGVYWGSSEPWIYYSFFVHLVFSGTLLAIFPFSKFAHVVYRPVALWVNKGKVVIKIPKYSETEEIRATKTATN